MRRKIINVKVADVEKRRYPSKHYVYIIQVKWDDGSDTVIFRRYSKFFDFQIGLLETFPREGGLRDPSERTIPFLPGKILFGRSHVREVAMKRLKPIDEYCSALVQLPPHISSSEHVLDFFESKPEDLNPAKEENKGKKKDQDINEISGPLLLEQYRAIADYTRTQAKELTITQEQLLEVIEKHENGWWFVSDEEGERGWVPGVYLEKRDGKPENLVTKQAELGQGEKYITTSQFTGEKDEISFGAGVLVEVLQKNLEGWWYVSYQGKEGWAPASYLEKPADAVLRQSNKANLSVKKNRTENRRSFPGDLRHSISSPIPTETTARASPLASSQRKHLQLTKTNSNPTFSKDAVKNTNVKPKVSEPILNRVRPPPKKPSLIQQNSTVLKPQKPPPLPPAPKPSSESIYEYFTSAPFSADIPHGISFEKDKKVTVLEKSPGDWWYISMGDKEGWAPASHVAKVFPDKKPKPPPARPKLPNVVKKPIESKNSAPVELNRSEKQKSGAVSPKSHFRKSPSPTTRNLKTTSYSVKRGSSNVTSSTEDSASKFDFKSVLNKTVSNQSNVQPDKPSPVAKKLPLKPTSVSNKSKVKSVQSSQNTINQRKPVAKPLPPNKNLKKPVISSVKPAQSNLENKNGHVDFRSVLKSSSDVSKTTTKNSEIKRPTVPGKPMLPSKPGLKNGNVKAAESKVSSNRIKIERNFQAKPADQSIKPVLKRFQQKGAFHNQNGNNNKALDNVRINEPEISATNLVANNRRGAPDGQVDDVITNEIKVSEKFEQTQTTCPSLLFTAVADFAPQNSSEMGFSKGDVATLLDKSNNNWWYMKINDKQGWVPWSYFEKCDNSETEPSSPPKHADIPFVEDEPVYSEIYENAGFMNGDEQGANLYRVVCDYSASDDSAVSAGKGDTVFLIDESEDWCFVRIIGSESEYLNGEGWLPSNYLEKM